MLTAFIRAFRTPDLRKKLLFTLGIIALFRFGSSLPAPGINEANVSYCANVAATSGLASTLQIVDLLSGNALKYMSVFALGIMPYITASIILQLLTVVIPRLETLKQEGQSGQAKITQYTRYLTVGLAVLQSTGYIELARSGTLFNGCGAAGNNPIIPNSSPFNIATALSMALAGAGGQTAAEIQSVLHLHSDSTYDAAVGALLADLAKAGNSGGNELLTANGLWVQK